VPLPPSSPAANILLGCRQHHIAHMAEISRGPPTYSHIAYGQNRYATSICFPSLFTLI
jgi:hypothetical protein